MTNIKTFSPGDLLRVQKEQSFYNDGYPSEKEKDYAVWNGLKKTYNLSGLPLNNKGCMYDLNSGEYVVFLDFLERIFTKGNTDYYNRQDVRYIQTGILLLHGKNVIFVNINMMRHDVFKELPFDMQSTFYETYFFKKVK